VSGRVLLVEDNMANQLLASAVLQRDGFEVDVAESASDALRCIGQHVPDIILMDIQLPELDGLTFTRQLKADPSTASITIVAMTAHAMVGDKEEALAAGCAGYIPKPIDTRTLGDQVRAFMQGAPAEAGT
jgi:CheY-like chemotaxis protein